MFIYFRKELHLYFNPVIQDLRRVKPKELLEIESRILQEKLSSIKEKIHNAIKAKERSETVKRGMQCAKKSGIKIGRPKVAESREKRSATPGTVK